MYDPTTDAEETKIDWFCEDLQHPLELTPKKKKKKVPFIIRDWNADLGSQEIPRITGKFDLEVQDEAGRSLTEVCSENTQVIANILIQQHKR